MKNIVNFKSGILKSYVASNGAFIPAGDDVDMFVVDEGIKKTIKIVDYHKTNTVTFPFDETIIKTILKEQNEE